MIGVTQESLVSWYFRSSLETLMVQSIFGSFLQLDLDCFWFSLLLAPLNAIFV